ncbi:MAG: serine/threonine protein kinase [Selenomonadaceae bacterium]|nr:serine/threonine protein kinase [Selenomonadaceae bacterium]
MNPLENLYDEIDRYKPDGSVRLMYDRIGQQVLVVKRRELNRRQLYQLLKKIQCQFLPEIYRLVESDGYLYIVEEQINGETLAQIVEYKGFLSETSAAKILLQICECLKELHLRKIVHRDLKPSNIMLTKDNQIKLIDLGISRIEKDFVESDTDVLGTKGYAPPEQFGFQQTDARSDIYSLGITMQQLLGNDYRGYLTKILKKCTEIDPAN